MIVDPVDFMLVVLSLAVFLVGVAVLLLAVSIRQDRARAALAERSVEASALV